VLGSIVVAGASTTVDPDLFHVLTLGRDAVAQGAIPMADAYAFTPTRVPVVHHEWLTGLLLYPVVATFGAPGLLWLAHVLHLSAIAIAVLLARRAGASLPVLAFLGPLGIAMALPGLTVLRAHVLTLIFTGALLWCLDADRRGARRWIAAWVALQLVWQSCHGGVAIGVILVALHAVEQWARGARIVHLVALLALAPALTLVGPYGAAYPAYLWEGLGMDRSVVGEWRTLADAEPFKIAIWAAATALLVFVVAQRGPRAAPGWPLVLALAAAAYRHQRLVSVYAIAWLAHVPAWAEPVRLGAVFRRLWLARPALTRAVLAAALAAAVARDVRERRWELRVPVVPDAETGIVYPAGVVEHLREHRLAGDVITPFELGAFVSWHLHPAIRVSLDGRFEAAFAPSLATDHLEFYAAAPSWERFLARHPADWVLAKATDPVVARLRASGAWSEVYVDDAFVLFGRTGSAAPTADRRGRRPHGRL
jgi:hypothetical protein